MGAGHDGAVPAWFASIPVSTPKENTVRRLLAVLACLALATPALAEEAKKGGNAQQNLMKECNEKAAGKKGADRKKFMSECLKS